MDKEKIALYRFGVIPRLLWVKKEDRRQEVLLREITSMPREIPSSGGSVLGWFTVVEWLRKYRDHGGKLESLESQERSDKGKARSLDEETEQALLRLKREPKGGSLPVIPGYPGNENFCLPTFMPRFKASTGCFNGGASMRRYETALPNDL